MKYYILNEIFAKEILAEENKKILTNYFQTEDNLIDYLYARLTDESYIEALKEGLELNVKLWVDGVIKWEYNNHGAEIFKILYSNEFKRQNDKYSIDNLKFFIYKILFSSIKIYCKDQKIQNKLIQREKRKERILDFITSKQNNILNYINKINENIVFIISPKARYSVLIQDSNTANAFLELCSRIDGKVILEIDGYKFNGKAITCLYRNPLKMTFKKTNLKNRDITTGIKQFSV